MAAAVTILVMLSGSASPSLTSAQDPPVPNPPANFDAEKGDTQVKLSWDDPSDFSISKYQLFQLVVSKLTADDRLRGDLFGYSVAVDGDTAVIGAYQDDDNGGDAGSAYVFTKGSDGWSQTANLTAADGAADDEFGISVAVDGDTNTIVVGARGDKNTVGGTDVSTGSAYVFTKDPDGWSQVAKLTASDPAEDDEFGISVAVDGGTVVVGAYQDDDNGGESGSAYVFTKPTNGPWVSTDTAAKLTASDGAADDEFGISVAVDGGTVVVGARGDKNTVGGTDVSTGSAYVFTKPTNGPWVSTDTAAKLTAFDGDDTDEFGISVAVDGNTAVVGARGDQNTVGGTDVSTGSAYVFTKDSDGWSQVAKLTASDGAADDEFGISVAVDGDTIVVGAYQDDDNGGESGSAYVFTEPDSGGWVTATQTAKLTASDGAMTDRYGYSVAVSGDTALVGAYSADTTGSDGGDGSNSGAAYFLSISGWTDISDSGSGTISHIVHPLDNDKEHRFRVRAVNAAGPGPASASAAATPMLAISQKPAGLTAVARDTVVDLSWVDPEDFSIDNYELLQITQGDKLPSAAAAEYDEFGYSVAVDGNTAVVGARGDESDTGAAYIFTKDSDGWSQVAKLTASDGATDDEFGISVAVDGDTNTIVVGARGDKNTVGGTDVSTGSAYVFTKGSDGWSQTAKLTASDGAADDEFGISVAVDGGTVVVGAYQDDDNGGESGSAYVFTKPTNGPWVSTDTAAKLTASDGAADDEFGISVAVDGGTVVVGAYQDDDNGGESGSAYVFTKPTNGPWVSTDTAAKLTASDGAADDEFGISVAVDGGTVVVGAYQDDDNADQSGSAYVFTKPDTGWADSNTAAKLTASDGAAGDEFGHSVAVDGDTVVVGAYQDDDYGTSSGSAYVFTADSSGEWSQKTKLTASDGAPYDYLGVSVGVEGGTVLAGANASDKNGEDSGSVYLWEVPDWRSIDSGPVTVYDTVTGLANLTEYSFQVRAVEDVAGDGPASDPVLATPKIDEPGQPFRLTASAGDTQVTIDWGDNNDPRITTYQLLELLQTKLTASDGGADDEFGYSVAVDGNTAVVGARGDESDTGAAYIFTKDSDGWSQVAKLTASDGATDDEFGISVAVDGDTNTIVVGARGDKNTVGGTDVSTGSAYVFTKGSDGWSQTANLTASDGAADDEFGISVAVDGGTVVVGAYQDDDNGGESGSAYVFTKPTNGPWVSTDTAAKLTASDGAADDEFGISVAVDGGTVVVGAYQDDDNGGESGSAYVFTKPTNGPWVSTDTAAKLTASDGAADDEFGISVAVDGGTVVVGAYQDDDNADQSGSAYVFIKPTSDSAWATATEAIKLTASDGEANDEFGISVAVDGNTIVVGARGDADGPTGVGVSGAGAAYVFARTLGVWSETLKLRAPDGRRNDWFGYSVAVAGETVLVGAVDDDDSGSNSGSAYLIDTKEWADIPGSDLQVDGNTYIYRLRDRINDQEYVYRVRAVNAGGNRSTGEIVSAIPRLAPPGKPEGLSAAAGDGQIELSWERSYDVTITEYQVVQSVMAKLTASDGKANDEFGYSVAMDGDTIVVSARGDNSDRGSAYVFTRESGVWKQVAKLTASDAAADDEFGYSVAVDGDTIVVGAYQDDDNGSSSGSAYVFTKSGGVWGKDPVSGTDRVETAKLTASDAVADDRFGYSVAVDGDTIVVGAYQDDDNGSSSGSAYVFTKSGGVWGKDPVSGTDRVETAKLTASDAAGFDYFGFSVAVDGDAIVVGARGASITNGAAYVFSKPDTDWASSNTAARLTASDGAAGDQFGAAVAVYEDTVVVGASRRDRETGSAYVFSRPNTGWADSNTAAGLTASDGAVGDYFGFSVAVDGKTIVVGAYQDNDNGLQSGSAYVFSKPASGGWATATGTAKLTASDGAANDEFGNSVAVDGESVMVGAPGGGNSGSIYVLAIPQSIDVLGSNDETTSYAVTGLTNGLEYTFQVRAVDQVGLGPLSDIIRATPVPAPPQLDSTQGFATGLWSDGATFWLAQNGAGADDAVYAYDLESRERVEDREFELDKTNVAPRGLWSDGATIWVSDSGEDKLFAHHLESGERLPDSDMELTRDNRAARGIWSDGVTMWVLDGRADALFAYDLETGALLGAYELDPSNDDPRGLWSDGVSVWVSDHGANRLFAYRLPAPEGPAGEDAEAGDLERVPGEEFTNLTRSSNSNPRGLWSDGYVMYVADSSDDRVYSYNMPDAIDARLASLTLSGVEIGEFSGSKSEYEGVLAYGVTETTVEAEPQQDNAAVLIEPADSAADANGHQTAVAAGAEVTVTVTSPDGSRTKVYRVRLAEAGPSANCLRGAVAAGFSLVVFEGGSIKGLVACAQSRHVTALYSLHDGQYLPYILGAPGFVNRPFRDLFVDGVPALTALVVASDGPPSLDPTPDSGAGNRLTQPWPECLRGAIATGFSLVLYEGGSIEDLEACAQSSNVTAFYTIYDGKYLPYVPGAPDFVNRPFHDRFVDGVPAVTPLIAKATIPPAE